MPSIKKFVVLVLSIVGIVGALVAINLVQWNWDSEKYNGGVCTACEHGEYKFSGGSHYKSDEKYYYTCTDCGHTIEVHSIMN